MKRMECSYCNGEKQIKVVTEEALEQVLSDFLKINNDSYTVDYRPCPRCRIIGAELEVESKHSRRILFW